MARRRVLLLLKPFDVYPPRPNLAAAAAASAASPRTFNPRFLSYLDDRRRVHKAAIDFCRSVLERKALDWELVLRNHLSCPIRHVDLVITVGGDGTLLQASHFLDGSIPVVGVNSDPTRVEEVGFVQVELFKDVLTNFLLDLTAACKAEVQYIVREPILPRDADIPLMHGAIKSSESMQLEWYSQEGVVYVDGSHVLYSVRHGDTIEMSSEAPILKVFLPPRLIS